jgi:hypothetical protein
MNYSATSPVSELLPVQALALLNRWAKLKYHFQLCDVEYLYVIKDRKILEWINSNEMMATRIIRRPNPTVEAMKKQIANGGEDLSALADYDESEALSLSLDEDIYFTFSRFCNDGYEVLLPDETIQAQHEEYQRQLPSLEKEILAYQEELARYEAAMNNHYQACRGWRQAREEAGKAWARKRKIPVFKKKGNNILQKGWLPKLEKQGFKWEQPQPSAPNITKPIQPKIDPPKTTYLVTASNYSTPIPEIEEAIAWAKSLVGEDMPPIPDLDDDFIYEYLRPALAEQQLQEQIDEVLSIFQSVISGELTNPFDIYKELKKYRIDYEDAIGMHNFRDYRGNYSHGDFGIWHRINLSPTGYWLVEFQSLLDTSISFHSPYDSSRLPVDVLASLPTIDSEERFGRPITEEEQRNYPILELLKILDYSATDFPAKLREPSPRRGWEYDEDDGDDGWWYEQTS